MNEYLNNLNILPHNKTIKDMRRYAKTNKVPIINDEGLILILQLVDLLKPKKFLEIGTAIGFCSICIASHNDSVQIDTIEKNEVMYQEAIQNINKAKLSNRIRVINSDALELDLNELSNDYDIIFIDGAKAQYIKFFEKYESILNDEGIIITDNLLFHGFVVNPKNVESKNLRALVSKIDYFNYWLKKNKNYRTSFFNIGDGIAISKRVKK